jgi:hypothetical protein
MKIFPLVVGILLVSTTLVHGFQPDDDLTARAAVLIDAVSGKVLYQKEGDLRLPPASTTKVMTALVTLESGRKYNEMLAVSKDPAADVFLKAKAQAFADLMLMPAMQRSLERQEALGRYGEDDDDRRRPDEPPGWWGRFRAGVGRRGRGVADAFWRLRSSGEVRKLVIAHDARGAARRRWRSLLPLHGLEDVQVQSEDVQAHARLR